MHFLEHRRTKFNEGTNTAGRDKRVVFVVAEARSDQQAPKYATSTKPLSTILWDPPRFHKPRNFRSKNIHIYINIYL